MRNLKIFALILFVGAIAFSSCKKDDPTGPTVTVTPVNVDAEKGTTVSFDYTISSNEKIKELTATPDNNIISAQTVTTFSGDFSATGTIEFSLPSSSLNVGDKINIVFKATDDSGAEYADETTVTITIVAGGTAFATEVTTGTFYHISGLLHGAYDLDGDATVSASGSSTIKSMINGDAAGATFTGSWGSGNSTTYVKDNTFDYTGATTEAAETAYSAGSASGTVTAPAANDIYIAKKGTTLYVIKITAVEPSYSTGTGTNTGRITFSYKK